MDTSAYRSLADGLGRDVEFTGYDEVDQRGAGQRPAGRRAARERGAARATTIELVLDRTPFYAEGGGQLADAGRIELDGAVIEVSDVQKPARAR